jgi:hypothetical protein
VGTVVNITDKTYQVHKGDVIGSFKNPEQSGEELVSLDDEVVASIFGEIGRDPKEPERGQTESIDPKQAKELEARLQIHATSSIRTRYRELIMVWYGMVIYSGLIFIVHILLIFFIDMSLNIL